jgi:hypothetical protein
MIISSPILKIFFLPEKSFDAEVPITIRILSVWTHITSPEMKVVKTVLLISQNKLGEYAHSQDPDFIGCTDRPVHDSGSGQ